MSAAPEIGPPLVLVLAALTASAALLARLGGLGVSRDVVVAAVRATVQLAAVSLLIAAVLGGAGRTGLFIVGMVAVAAATAGRRITGSVRGRAWWTVVP
ncbi:MAG: ABC transporter permease, partial [Actinomadura rubrobrunea]|nr:ABC transporter permease [Actinomadura rubrobrunea]